MKTYNQKIVKSLNKNASRRIIADMVTALLGAGAITGLTATCYAAQEGRLIPALILLTASITAGGACMGLVLADSEAEENINQNDKQL